MPGYADRKNQLFCVTNKLWNASGWLSFTMDCYAVYKMHSRLQDTGYTYHYKERGDLADALRHMWMQGLLCKYYHYAISSKVKRLNFAESAGIFWEQCSTNNTDESEMDLHNNRIGRDIFNRLTTYNTLTIDLGWFGSFTITYGLNTPDDWKMKKEAGELLKNNVLNVVTEVKKKGEYPNYEQYKICSHKHWIKYEADKNRPVVIPKPKEE